MEYELETLRKPNKKSIKISMGVCGKCGNVLIRPVPCDIAVCECESVVEVPLASVKMFQVEVRLPSDLHSGLKVLAERRKVGLNEALIYAITHGGVE